MTLGLLHSLGPTTQTAQLIALLSNASWGTGPAACETAGNTAREMSGSVKALSRWLVVVAALRLLSVYIGIFDPFRFRTNLIDLQPDLVNDLYGRLFATWTTLTCGLCLICARNPTNAAIYGATLLSFVVALVHFSTELLVFKTMSIKGAAPPLVFAGLSTLWMGAGWNYYTVYSKQAEDGPASSDKTEAANGPTEPKKKL